MTMVCCDLNDIEILTRFPLTEESPIAGAIDLRTRPEGALPLPSIS
jgi:hypothetical protein